MATELVSTTQSNRREITQVIDPVPMFDTARFEHMQRVAGLIARSSMVPKTLCMTKEDNQDVMLPFENVLSNCFLVVNQATRWGMDPFAVISCCSVVHGRLGYEGKLVAAVLEAKLGISLIYEWNDAAGDAFGIKVTGTLPDGRVESIDGTVGQWKTTGPGSPWPKQPKLQLAYRGAREWARLYAPGVMLGVYSEDELAELVEDARARRANPVARIASAGAAESFQNPLVKTGAQDTQQQGGQHEVAAKEEASEAYRQRVDSTVGSASATSSNSQVDKTTTDSAAAGTAAHPSGHAAGHQPAAGADSAATAETSAKPAPADAGPSAGTAGSAQPDLLAGASSPDAGGKAQPASHEPEKGAVASDAAAAPKRNGPDMLESYHKALLSIESGGPAKLLKQAQAWGNKHGAFEADPSVARDTIYALHLKRLTGEITKEDCIKRVGALLPK